MALDILKKVERLGTQKEVADSLDAYERELQRLEKYADEVSDFTEKMLDYKETSDLFWSYQIAKEYNRAHPETSIEKALGIEDTLPVQKSYGNPRDRRWKYFSIEERAVIHHALKNLQMEQVSK